MVTFPESLRLPAKAGFIPVRDKVLEIVQEHIQSIAETYDQQAVDVEEKWLRGFFNDYYKYCTGWIGERLSDSTDKEDHPDAVKAKIEAKKTILDLQDSIIEFALCYMHINRYTTLLRDELKSQEERTGHMAHHIKWSSDMGVGIEKYKAQKARLQKDYKRLSEIEPLVKETDSDLAAFSSLLDDFLSKDKKESFLRSFQSSLRTADFTKSERVLNMMLKEKKKFSLDQKKVTEAQKKAKTLGLKLLEIFKKNEDQIKGPDEKLILRSTEVENTKAQHAEEMKKVRAFLIKYQLPYMQHKLSNLQHLREKLLVAGTLDSLVALYVNMVVGLSQPIENIKVVREYEGEVVNKAIYLLQSQFKEIPNIRARADETVSEFRTAVEEFDQELKKAG